MTEELKPCPFCGGMPSYQKSELYGSEQSPSYVKCRHCNFYIAKSGPSSDAAVLNIWNTRPVDVELDKLRKISGLVSYRHGDDIVYSCPEDEDKDLPSEITIKRIFAILDGEEVEEE